MAKKEQPVVEQSVEAPKEEQQTSQQHDVIETSGVGTFVLPDGTIKTTN